MASSGGGRRCGGVGGQRAIIDAAGHDGRTTYTACSERCATEVITRPIVGRVRGAGNVEASPAVLWRAEAILARWSYAQHFTRRLECPSKASPGKWCVPSS